MFNSCFTNLYDSTNEFFFEVKRKARKEHRCCECHCQINPGEKYEVATGKSDGYFWEYKTCAPCSRIRKSLFKSWVYEEMWERIREEYCEVDKDSGEYEDDWLR